MSKSSNFDRFLLQGTVSNVSVSTTPVSVESCRIQSQKLQIFEGQQDMIQGICPWKTVNKLDTYNPR